MTSINNLSNTLSWKEATGPIDYPACNDLMFHLLLQNNEDILQGLISSLLHIPLNQIVSTTVENPIMLPDYIIGKMFHLDIQVNLNNDSIINLEMQVVDEKNWRDRSLSYLCRNFDNVARGADYTSVMPVTHIGILDFDLDSDLDEFYSTYKLSNIRSGYVFNDKFTLSVLSLNHIDNANDEDIAWEVDKWAQVFKAKTWEDLKMAATTTTLEKVADSIFVQNTDKQIRYALFKKQEAEIHEARLNAELAEKDAELAELRRQLAELKGKQ